jgi:NAD(P)-dependent dehydrogenase (short-subunit alcohol dehydrogenase family)
MRAALVTGSTSGIGLSTARKLFESGFAVSLHGKTSWELLPTNLRTWVESSPLLHYQSADLSETGAPGGLVQGTVARWGTLDCLVSNAAMTLHAESSEVLPAQWEEVFRVNVQAPFFLAQAALSQLALRSGSIIFVSSTNANRVNKKNLAYDASKAALNHMAKGIALEARSSGVRVNVVMPGGIDTPMLQRWLVDYTGSSDAAETFLAEGKKSGLVGAPDDVADSILFLASDAAKWVTGASLIADGGAYLEEG